MLVTLKMSHQNDYAIVQVAESEKEANADSALIALQDDVVKIFEYDCATSGCHRGRRPKKKLNLEADQMVKAMVNVPSIGIDSLKLVDLENPEKSYLLMKIKGSEGIVDDRMPIEAPPLPDAQIQTIEDWIMRLVEAEKMKKSETQPNPAEK
jgi:hypothetical protein